MRDLETAKQLTIAKYERLIDILLNMRRAYTYAQLRADYYAKCGFCLEYGIEDKCGDCPVLKADNITEGKGCLKIYHMDIPNKKEPIGAADAHRYVTRMREMIEHVRKDF